MRIPNAAGARAAGTDEPASPGTYIMRIKRIREKNGRLLLLWEVATGPSKGSIAWDGYSLDNPKACGLLIRRLEAMGVDVDDNGFFDESSATGKIAEVQLVQNGTFINVKTVAAADPSVLPATESAAASDDDEVPF